MTKEKVKTSLDDRIKKVEETLKKLKEKKKKSKKVELSKSTPKMDDLLNLIQTIADENKVKVADVVLAVARIKRTGLKLENRSKLTNEENALL